MLGCNSQTSSKEVTFRVNEGYLEWQYVGDSEWTKLYNYDIENPTWKTEVLNNPSGLDFFLDFIDSYDVALEIAKSYYNLNK